jgi:hypothetical protein
MGSSCITSIPNNRHLRNREIDTGNGHIYRTIRALHQFTVEIWAARNKQLHKRDDKAAARIRTPIDAVIKHLYHQLNLLHATDRFHCDTPLTVLTKLRPSKKHRWVRRVQQAQVRYAELPYKYQTDRTLPASFNKHSSATFSFRDHPTAAQLLFPTTSHHPRQHQTTIHESTTAPT